MTVFGDRAFKEIIQLNKVMRVGTIELVGRGRDTRAHSCSLSAHTQSKGHASTL